MSRRLVTAILLSCAIAAAQRESAVFKVDINLVTVYATVTDTTGRRIADLRKVDFSIYEDGIRREIRVFESRPAAPLSVALLIDTSLSASVDLRRERKAASRFLHAFASEGVEFAAALYGFDWRVSRKTSFLCDPEVLDSRLPSIKGEAGTSLYDAVRLASRDLSARQGRHVIVALTDGVDTASACSFTQAVDAARSAGVEIFSVFAPSVGHDVAGVHTLITLAGDSGGRVFGIASSAGLDAAFDDLAKRLGAQYIIGYYRPSSPTPPSGPSQIRIDVARRNLKAIVSRSSCAYENESEPVYYCASR